jgi:hypothetical protein
MSANAIAVGSWNEISTCRRRQAAKTHPHAKPQQIAAWEKRLGAPLRSQSVLHFALTQSKRTRYITIGRQGRETESVVSGRQQLFFFIPTFKINIFQLIHSIVVCLLIWTLVH